MRHRFRYPPARLAITWPSTPPELLHRGGDAPLIGSANPCCFKMQGVARHLGNRDLGLAHQMVTNGFFPSIGLVTRCLLRRDDFLFKRFVRPPRVAKLET